MSDAKTNEFEDEECSYGECENTPTHSLYHGEYHYCDKHYVIIGECAYCGTPIHESWDCSPTMCRPCGKDRSECEKCDEVFLSEKGDHDDEDLFCCPSCLGQSNCDNCGEECEETSAMCEECNKVMSYCANALCVCRTSSAFDHDSSKAYVMDEMWRCGDGTYYCCRECCPTDKRRKRIHPPKIRTVYN